MTISVFLVDDHELVRTGLRTVLDAQPDIVVVGEAGSRSQGLSAIRDTPANVAILDVRLPDGDGVTLCREIRTLLDPPPACLMLTSYSDDDALFGAIMAGASGYLMKRVAGSAVVDAVRTVAAGGSLLDSGLTSTVMSRIRGDNGRPDPGYALLTPQERRVLDLVAEGLTNRQIAERLSLAEKTAKNHVSSILHKLGFERRTEAAVYATRRRPPDAH
ncbi:response regulator [Phytoactinopolyspora mesophila]|uniref:Response regulator n=1 Tax=Phytoactinopolyspora mesophila TaxID=2650750 RepID=A0A7K3M1Q0_9ACTN|nr:response regulator transcription factor [Phytoactinopolyspora mesophila]NDL56358.1 response regulator [Phytoactinopolyspora mesophila]